MHLKTGKFTRFISTIFIKNGCNKPFKYIEIKVKSLPDSVCAKIPPKKWLPVFAARPNPQLESLLRCVCQIEMGCACLILDH